MNTWCKRIVWSLAGIAVVYFLYRAFQPAPVLVEVGSVRRGTLQVTADDDGRTRVRERYTISAPIEGRLLRTRLDPGDEVIAGESIVAEFVPIAPDFLDPRSRAEAEARLLRAKASLLEAQARQEQAQADQRFAKKELQRIRELREQGIESAEVFDRAERDDRRAQEGLRAAEFAAQVARYERDISAASLLEVEPQDLSEDSKKQVEPGPPPRDDPRRLGLRSPITGQVLRVFEESARTLMAGAPILEVGNPGVLEMVADYLSQEAVKVKPGMTVFVEGWGGELPTGEKKTLHGRVRVVEPSGFTKTSALGVEEQRVNIIVDPIGDPQDWIAIGDGYRVELRILLWHQDDVLIVPTGAFFRDADSWYVFLLQNEEARKRAVQIGRQNGLDSQVLGGLAEGDRVVLYPSDFIKDRTPVETR